MVSAAGGRGEQRPLGPDLALPKGAIVDIWLDPIRDVGLSQEGLAQAGVKTAFEIICDCPAEVAAQRYASRIRHPGHLPPDRAALQRIHNSSVLMRPLEIGQRSASTQLGRWTFQPWWNG